LILLAFLLPMSFDATSADRQEPRTGALFNGKDLSGWWPRTCDRQSFIA